MANDSERVDEPQMAQAYFALKETEENTTSISFSFGTDIDLLRDWANDVEPTVGEGSVSDAAPTEDTIAAESQPLADLLAKVTETGLGLSELILALGAVRSIFSGLVSRIEVVEPIKQSSEIIEQTDSYKIFGITEDRLVKVRDHHRKLLRQDKGFDLIPTSILLTMVSSFDAIMSEIVGSMFRLKPERYVTGDRSIAVSAIMSMSSFDEFRAKLVDDEIYQFSRGSHEEQVTNLEKWFNVDIIKDWKKWPNFIEIFERRNLIAHGESKFTDRYVRICKKHGSKKCDDLLGKDIELKIGYLIRSLDVLIEFLTLLIFVIWRKNFQSEEHKAFDAINTSTYQFISQERYRLPINIIEFVLSQKNTKIGEITRLMLTINLASALRHLNKDTEKCIEVLDRVDWAASSDNFRICVAALKDDIAQVCDLMPNVVAAKTISKADFREWPVFDYVRDKPEFARTFESVFGDVLFDPAIESTNLKDKPDDLDGDVPSVVH